VNVPIRIRLSRAKGFNLQAVSRAFNGLDALKVSRPGLWGNPFVVTEKMKPGATVGGAWNYIAVPTAEDAVACYEMMLTSTSVTGQRGHELRSRLPDLRGKNLACWCRHDAPCHADVLLRLANSIRCEAA
jgi:hypothetical protein